MKKINCSICSRRPNSTRSNLTVRHLNDLRQPTTLRNHFPCAPLMVLHTPLQGCRFDLSEQIFPNSACILLVVCVLAIYPPNTTSPRLCFYNKTVWPVWIVCVFECNAVCCLLTSSSTGANIFACSKFSDSRSWYSTNTQSDCLKGFRKLKKKTVPKLLFFCDLFHFAVATHTITVGGRIISV